MPFSIHFTIAKMLTSTNMYFPDQVQKLSSFLFNTCRQQIIYFLKSITGALTAGLNYYRANISIKNGQIDVGKANDVDADLGDGDGGMFMLGGKDPFMSQILLNATVKMYPRMRVVGIPSAGHFLQQDHPEITNKIIRDFLGPASDCSVEKLVNRQS